MLPRLFMGARWQSQQETASYRERQTFERGKEWESERVREWEREISFYKCSHREVCSKYDNDNYNRDSVSYSFHTQILLWTIHAPNKKKVIHKPIRPPTWNYKICVTVHIVYFIHGNSLIRYSGDNNKRNSHPPI